MLYPPIVRLTSLRRGLLGASLVLAIALAVTADAVSALAQAPPSDTFVPSVVRRMMERSVRIAPHVYAFHAPLSSGAAPLANEMLIEQADGLILVDAGKTRGAGERIVSLIRSISDKPLRAVILTHWHQDHVLGLGPIVEAWPEVQIVSSRRTLDYILTDESFLGAPRARGETADRDRSRAATLRGYADQMRSNLHDPNLSEAERRGWVDVVGVLDQRIADEQGTYLVVPTVTFDESYNFPDPVAPVEARFIGAAHTDGDVVVWLPTQRVVATGDMVVAPIPYTGDNILEWPETLRALKRLRPRIIVPGHGPVMHDTRSVDRLIVAMTAFRAAAEKLLRGPSLTEEQVQAEADVAEQVRIFSGRDPGLQSRARNTFPAHVSGAYDELRRQQTE